jgi:NAD(P)-dependent dehydrogenase (short-subunit alcohol dehydrogenase family)
MGGIDVLVNSAGVWMEGPAEEVSEEQWSEVIDTNLKGTFFMCRYAIPYLEKSAGCIINLSSDSGLVGNDLASVYCASKGGVTLLTKSLAVELARKNIRVNAVCPGDVATPMLDRAVEEHGGGQNDKYIEQLLEIYPERPGRRFTKPEEVARSILFLASGSVEAITGACLSIDFGLTAGY